jgi:hypothetical protein
VAIGAIVSFSCADTGAAKAQAAARAAARNAPRGAEVDVEHLTMAVSLPPEDSAVRPEAGYPAPAGVIKRRS